MAAKCPPDRRSRRRGARRPNPATSTKTLVLSLVISSAEVGTMIRDLRRRDEAGVGEHVGLQDLVRIVERDADLVAPRVGLDARR